MTLRPTIAVAASAVPLAAALAVTVPGDHGRYAATFSWGGLPAWAAMPSVLAVTVWLAVAPAVLGPVGFVLGRNDATYRTLRDLLGVTPAGLFGGGLYAAGVLAIRACSALGPAAAGPLAAMAVLVLPGIGAVAAAWLWLLGSYIELAAVSPDTGDDAP